MQSLPCLFFRIKIVWGKIFDIMKEGNATGKEKWGRKNFTDDCKHQRKILPALKGFWCYFWVPVIIVCIFGWEMGVTEVKWPAKGQNASLWWSQPKNSHLLAHCTEVMFLIRTLTAIQAEPPRLPRLGNLHKAGQENFQGVRPLAVSKTVLCCCSQSLPMPPHLKTRLLQRY